jgi:glycosyltransferase involved in cell wall biosynthesis
LNRSEIRVGFLSLANHFHVQRWAEAFSSSGIKVFVYSPVSGDVGNAELRVIPPRKNKLTYSYYYYSAKKLHRLLESDKITHVIPIHLSPFGSWAVHSRYGNLFPYAIGADVLEFASPPPPWKRSWSYRENDFWIIKMFRKLIRDYYFKFKVMQVVKHSNLMFSDNHAIANVLIDKLGAKKDAVRVIPWGIDLQIFNSITENEIRIVKNNYLKNSIKNIVLFPRGLKYIYQTDIFLNGISQYLDKGGNAYFFILTGAGYNPDKSILKNALTLESKYPNAVKIERDFLSEKEMKTLILSSDVVVSIPYYDGFSTTLAEAMYAGAIPMVNNIPGNMEIIQDSVNGILLDSLTPESIANKLSLTEGKIQVLKSKYGVVNKKWVEQNAYITLQAQKIIDLLASNSK